MSSTLYRKAFETQLRHSFYVYTGQPVNNEFKVNRDMALVPTRECEELMRRGRMRFVPTLKGFTAFYQAYVNGSNVIEPLTKLSDDSEFVFSMHLNVAAIDLFLNVSNLNVGSKTYTAGKFLMFDFKVESSTPGPPGAGPLTLNVALANSLRASIFGYSFKPNPAWNTFADIKVYAGSNLGPNVLTIPNIPYNATNGTFSAEIDLSGQPKGFYVLEAYKAGTAIVIDSNDFYIDNDLVSKNTFGVIRIKYADIDKMYESVSDVDDFFTFDHLFPARSVKWRYYVVAENLDPTFFNTWDLKVIKAGGPVFNASYHPPDDPFDQQYGQPDPTVPVNGLPTVVLESVSAIAFSEDPRQGFNLFKTPVGGGSDDPMVSNLPNANPVGVDADSWGPAQTPIQNPTSGISEIYVFI